MVRRYQVKYVVHEEGGTYSYQHKEFRALRDAAVFIDTILSNDQQEFLEIKAVIYDSLTPSERGIVVLLTNSRILKSGKDF